MHTVESIEYPRASFVPDQDARNLCDFVAQMEAGAEGTRTRSVRGTVQKSDNKVYQWRSEFVYNRLVIVLHPDGGTGGTAEEEEQHQSM